MRKYTHNKDRGRGTFPTAIFREGKWYRYDRYTKRGVKGKQELKKIAEAGKRNGVLKSYRIIKANHIKGCYGLYIN